MGTEVRVQIDQARRHQPAPHIDALHAAVGRDACRDGRDLAVADPDVALAPQLLTGVEHVSVGDHQLVPQRGIGGIEAARRGRAGGLRDQHRRLRLGGTAQRAARGDRRARRQEVST